MDFRFQPTSIGTDIVFDLSNGKVKGSTAGPALSPIFSGIASEVYREQLNQDVLDVIQFSKDLTAAMKDKKPATPQEIRFEELKRDPNTVFIKVDKNFKESLKPKCKPITLCINKPKKTDKNIKTLDKHNTQSNNKPKMKLKTAKPINQQKALKIFMEPKVKITEKQRKIKVTQHLTHQQEAVKKEIDSLKKKRNQSNEVLLDFESNKRLLKYGSVVLLDKKMASSTHSERAVVNNVNFGKSYIVTNIGCKILTIPFRSIRAIVDKPSQFIENKLQELRNMFAFYDSKGNCDAIRWFYKDKLIATFKRHSFDKPLTVEIKEHAYYEQHFKAMYRRFETFLKANDMSLYHFILDKPKNDLERFSAIFNLIFDYLKNKQFLLYNFKAYLDFNIKGL